VTNGEREGVRANLIDLGLEGALDYGLKRLAYEKNERIRRLMKLTVAEAGKQLREKVTRSRRLLAGWRVVN
jgi:hypothetical protein